MVDIEEILNSAWRNAFINVYKRHNIEITEWKGPIPSNVKSTVPRSYFDFIDDLEKAEKEVEEILRG